MRNTALIRMNYFNRILGTGELVVVQISSYLPQKRPLSDCATTRSKQSRDETENVYKESKSKLNIMDGMANGYGKSRSIE
jgi:hypothetical protein